MKLKILFVDDEPNVLQGLRRMLRTMREEWETGFAGSGAEALELLEREPWQVVVSDMRMPGMDGAQLLTEIKKRHPHVVRIILSGQSDREAVLKTVRPAHQYLHKPCDAETLKACIERARLLRDLLADESLRRVASQVESLPSLPSLYVEILRELESEYASIQRVGQIIARDIGMTAKILQLVNSAFFGFCRHVSSPAQAAELLGLETIKVLVLSVKIFSQFDRAALPGISVERLWEHSLAVGALARTIAAAEKQGQTLVDNAFMTGVLHDAGKLILAANFPEACAEARTLARQQGLPLWQAEMQVFGVSHAELGAYLLSLWGLPEDIVKAIGHHHRPGALAPADAGLAVTVHVANALEYLEQGRQEEKNERRVDLACLQELRLVDKLPLWESRCREALGEGKDHATKNSLCG